MRLEAKHPAPGWLQIVPKKRVRPALDHRALDDPRAIFACNSESSIHRSVVNDHNLITGINRLQTAPEPKRVVVRVNKSGEPKHKNRRDVASLGLPLRRPRGAAFAGNIDPRADQYQQTR